MIVVFLQETPKSVSRNDDTLLSLVNMGFKEEEALMAIERLGVLRIIHSCICSRLFAF